MIMTTSFEYIDAFDSDNPERDLRVVLRNVKIIYPNLFAPKSVGNGTPKYSLQVLIPKADSTTIVKLTNYFSVIKKYATNAGADAAATYFRDGDIQQNRDHVVLKNGDAGFKDYLQNHKYFNLNAKMGHPPSLRDVAGKPISREKSTDPFYTGCTCDVYFYSFVIGGTFTDKETGAPFTIAPTVSKHLMAVQLTKKSPPIITRSRPKITNDIFINYTKEHISDSGTGGTENEAIAFITEDKLKKALLDFTGSKHDPDYQERVAARKNILKRFYSASGKLADLDPDYYDDVFAELEHYDDSDV